MEPKHKVHEPYGIRPSTAPRIRDMRIGQIAQIVEPQARPGFEYESRRYEAIRGQYIICTQGGVFFLANPRAGWQHSVAMKLEHRIRILPIGATVEITVGA